MARKKLYGECRICGEEKLLSEEHYIPRAAGGGEKIKLYSGTELFKTLYKDEDDKNQKPYGKIKQSGLSDYTLCKECNEQSGSLYDKEFSRFFNGVHYGIMSEVKIPEGRKVAEYLEGKIFAMELDIKPFNIAKRILVSFCSVEHASLAKRMAEIKKAIQEKDYHPDTKDFAIYLSLHVGNSAYYGTIAAIKSVEGRSFSQVYAGIESGLLAFYFSGDTKTKATGLDNCADITSWLTKYEYDQTVRVKLELMFNKTLNLQFPI